MNIPRKGHLPALDGLRGLAILSVIIFHYTRLEGTTALDALARGIFRSGWIGVDLFFVLSGFLITRILLNTREQPAYFRNFYARRAVRIFPLYYAYLAGVVFVLPMLLPGDSLVQAYAADGPWHFTYLSNVLQSIRGHGTVNGHLWSLAVEEQFYLLWPLLVFALPARGIIRASLALIAMAVLVRICLLAFLPANHALTSLALLPARIDALAIGGLVAVISHTGGYARMHAAALPVLFSCGTALVLLGLMNHELTQRSALTSTLGLTILALACAALIVRSVGAPPESFIARALEAPWLTTIGKYSYCMYIVHGIAGEFAWAIVQDLPIPTLFGSELPRDLVMFAAGTGLTFSIAAASWRLWEAPWLRLKDHFLADQPSTHQDRVSALARESPI